MSIDKIITFGFKDSVSPDSFDGLYNKFGSMEGIDAVGPFYEGESDVMLQRIGIIKVQSGYQVEDVLKTFKNTYDKYLSYAEIPPERKLL